MRRGRSKSSFAPLANWSAVCIDHDVNTALQNVWFSLRKGGRPPPLAKVATAMVALAVWLALASLAGLVPEAAALAGFAVAAWAGWRLSRERLPVLSKIFVLSMVLNSLGWVFEFYADVPGFDEVAHFLTGTCLTGMLGYLCFRQLFVAKDVAPWQLALAIVSLGAAMGALWEIVEWFAYLMTGRPGIIKSLNDTVSDLLWDFLGGALALPVLWHDVVHLHRGREGRPAPFQWRWFFVLAGVTTLIWFAAENRGDDAVVVEGKRQVAQTYRDGDEVEPKERLGEENLYEAIRKTPREYVGKKFIFRRSVSKIVGPTVIKVDADGMVGSDEIVVTIPEGQLPPKLRVGDQLEILGSARISEGKPLIIGEAVLDHAGDE